MSAASTTPVDQVSGWRYPRTHPSLPESHHSVLVPRGVSFWRKALAFAGPGYMVAVGYMDPGNWATDLAGGARFGYTLLSVILISNLMAILLQALALKLGIVTGRDLAQACRDHYSRPVSFALWVLCEIAIAACDLAEVIGSAIALNLLFGIPLVWGVCLTALDVLAHPAAAARGLPLPRGVRHRARRDHRRLLRGSSSSWHSRPWPSCASGLLPRTEIVTQPGDAVHRHRHSRRHGDAAQPLSALVDRADAEGAARRRVAARGDPLRARSTRRSRCSSPSSSTRPSSSWRPPRSTQRATRKWPTSATPTGC